MRGKDLLYCIVFWEIGLWCAVCRGANDPATATGIRVVRPPTSPDGWPVTAWSGLVDGVSHLGTWERWHLNRVWNKKALGTKRSLYLVVQHWDYVFGTMTITTFIHLYMFLLPFAAAPNSSKLVAIFVSVSPSLSLMDGAQLLAIGRMLTPPI